MESNDSSLITKKQLMERFNLPNVQAVNRLMRQKKIPFVRFGYRTTRFSIPAVERAIAKLTVKEAGGDRS